MRLRLFLPPLPVPSIPILWSLCVPIFSILKSKELPFFSLYFWNTSLYNCFCVSGMNLSSKIFYSCSNFFIIFSSSFPLSFKGFVSVALCLFIPPCISPFPSSSSKCIPLYYSLVSFVISIGSFSTSICISPSSSLSCPSICKTWKLFWFSLTPCFSFCGFPAPSLTDFFLHSISLNPSFSVLIPSFFLCSSSVVPFVFVSWFM